MGGCYVFPFFLAEGPQLLNLVVIPVHWLDQICYVKKQGQIRGTLYCKECVWFLYRMQVFG